jgi:hypothetical protein
MPPTSNLDTHLASLLSPERAALVDLAGLDPEAAALLGRHLSGYALLRRFYTTRDEANAASGSLTRKRQAATTLLSIIESASDCIRGGLFDPEVESVVPVEGLLMLLGEALPLFGQTSPTGKPQRVFEQKQLFALMAVVEDFEGVSGRVREGGEAILKASMGCFRSDGSGAALKKSVSGLSASMSGSGMLSGSGSWERLAESSWEMLQSTETMDGKKAKGGAKAVELKRAWDWRKGLDAVATSADVGSPEVVMLLRTALAREIGKAWANGWA